MCSAQCQKMRKGAINCFVVSLDSELAQVGDESVRLLRSDTTLALRHREDVRDFDEPPGRNKCRLGSQSIQQGRRLGRRFVVEQPSHGDRTIKDKRRTNRGPSLKRSLTFHLLKE